MCVCVCVYVCVCVCVCVCVQNYRERNAFIVTQAPLEETVKDFWRMIWETKSAVIVMLTGLVEDDQVRYNAIDHRQSKSLYEF